MLSLNLTTYSVLGERLLTSIHPNNIIYHYGVLPRIAYSFLTFPDRSDLIRTSIYEAIKPGIAEFLDYLYDLVEDAKKEYFTGMFLFFPVVVFSGLMFEYTYNDQGGIIKPTNHVVFVFKEAFKKASSGNTYLIDFVRADYLQKFLQNQVNEILQLINFLNNNKFKVKAIPISYLKALLQA